MRIQSDINVPQALGTGEAAQSGARTAPGSNGGALAPDTSNLSSSGANVLALATVANQLPEIRQEKVAALAQQVRGGAYSPQAERSAEALMSHMLLASAA
ncbi:MAG: flagellar biosynthesis anti-sigma factor FlgM [Terriglobales bacterium]